MSIPVITIIARSGAGKTTLLEKLIPQLKRRGYHIATVKHHSHAGFEIDQPQKDSWRHARAGSEHVVIAAPDKLASYRLLKKELTLDEIVREIADVDLILVEGYKNAGKPSIEIIRSGLSSEPISAPENLIAYASDIALKTSVPVFDLDDVDGLAACIESFLAQNPPA
ncbi:MAG: molybdopterin-guanine dinucleotide biosynthesis protein B [Anaerolineales bacterium]|jgi:molybdopterin-guanine dinucleotide biosynthesis protein B|nr:molybdopterin-guanine dinucleotide biosynthesis protein B [Anaerolineales bacterium]